MNTQIFTREEWNQFDAMVQVKELDSEMSGTIKNNFLADCSKAMTDNTLKAGSSRSKMCEAYTAVSNWLDLVQKFQEMGIDVHESIASAFNKAIFTTFDYRIKSNPDEDPLAMGTIDQLPLMVKFLEPCMSIDKTESIEPTLAPTYQWTLSPAAEFAVFDNNEDNLLAVIVNSLKDGAVDVSATVTCGSDSRTATRQIVIGDPETYISFSVLTDCPGGSTINQKYTGGYVNITEPSAYYDSGGDYMNIIAYENESSFIMLTVNALPTVGTVYDITRATIYYQTAGGILTSWYQTLNGCTQVPCTEEYRCTEIPDGFGGWTQSCDYVYNVCCSGTEAS